MPIGMPGCPELAFWTASMASARMALASSRRCEDVDTQTLQNLRFQEPRILDHGLSCGNGMDGPRIHEPDGGNMTQTRNLARLQAYCDTRAWRRNLLTRMQVDRCGGRHVARPSTSGCL